MGQKILTKNDFGSITKLKKFWEQKFCEKNLLGQNICWSKEKNMGLTKIVGPQKKFCQTKMWAHKK